MAKVGGFAAVMQRRYPEMKYRRVIFVSTDNTCLGPAAESIFNRIAGGREIEAISRGLVVLFPEPMNANPKTAPLRKSLF